MASQSALSKANTTFGLHLLTKLRESDETDNIFLSPYSIYSALAMLLLGAKGNTQQQIAEVLEILNYQGDFPQSFGELQKKIHSKDPSYSLHSANRLYGEQTYNFLESFLKECRTTYGAELEPVNFLNQAEKARVNINHWVEKQTGDKIKDLLTSGTVDDSTKLVLVNAIYFKASWERQFSKHGTTDGKFWISEHEWKPVKMMNQSGEFRYAAIPDIGCKVLELPYKGGDLSMIVVLPDKIEDGSAALQKLRRELTCDNFKKWTHHDTMTTASVQVTLPRFNIEQKSSLIDILQSMGMVDAFDPAKSDFSGMSPRNDIAVSEVIHQAFIHVNEEGTEAAAATAVVMMKSCFMVTKWESFVADHPFLFFIQHKSSSVLFAGAFITPK